MAYLTYCRVTNMLSYAHERPDSYKYSSNLHLMIHLNVVELAYIHRCQSIRASTFFR